jgi:hypothetical protein
MGILDSSVNALHDKKGNALRHEQGVRFGFLEAALIEM